MKVQRINKKLLLPPKINKKLLLVQKELNLLTNSKKLFVQTPPVSTNMFSNVLVMHQMKVETINKKLLLPPKNNKKLLLVQKELDLLSEGKAGMIVVVEVTLETGGVALKTRISKSLAEL
jgi:hypothetical protein